MYILLVESLFLIIKLPDVFVANVNLFFKIYVDIYLLVDYIIENVFFIFVVFTIFIVFNMLMLIFVKKNKPVQVETLGFKVSITSLVILFSIILLLVTFYNVHYLLVHNCPRDVVCISYFPSEVLTLVNILRFIVLPIIIPVYLWTHMLVVKM